MRRPRTALAWVMAVFVIALSASFLKAQMFGKRLGPPPNPDSDPSANAAAAVFNPPVANRGARQLLRNGLDYLQTYKDPVRAGRYLEQASARRAELSPDEQKALDAALTSARTQVASQAQAPNGLPSLPPRPQTAVAAQSAPVPSLPALPVLSPVPQTTYGPEPGIVRTSGETDPAPAPLAVQSPEPLPAAEPLPEGEPIGLTVLTDPSEHLVGLGASDPSEVEAAPALEPMPALPVEPTEVEAQPEPSPALFDEPPALDAQAEVLPALPTDAEAPALEVAEPAALEAQPEPPPAMPIEAPAPEAAEPPALPALPGPALEPEPEALEPPPLAAPAARNQPAPGVEAVPPVLPPDASTAMPEDSGLILEPPVEAASSAIEAPVLPSLPVADEPVSAPALAPVGMEAPPLELGAPAPVALPEPAPDPDLVIRNAASDPSMAQKPGDVMPVEPPPAPDASELPGIDLSNLSGQGPEPTREIRTVDQTLAPVPTPEPAAQPQPVSPPPAEAPVRQVEAPSRALAPLRSPIHDPRMGAAAPGAPIPQGTATLNPETLREIEEIARRQEEDLKRNPNPYDIPPPRPGGPGGPSMGPSTGAMGYPADPSGSRAELPRAPSPTEARPIRPIAVPEETVQLPPRVFQPNRKYWSSPATCTMPLYFQDAVLERYGQSVEQAMGPAGRYFSYPLDDPRQSNQRMQILQPFYSAGMFFLQVGALPYNLVVDPPWESHYQLGYFRPGDPTPPDLYYLPTTGIGPPLHGKRYGRGYNHK